LQKASFCAKKEAKYGKRKGRFLKIFYTKRAAHLSKEQKMSPFFFNTGSFFQKTIKKAEKICNFFQIIRFAQR
jgi:hypothetical protein